MNVELELDEFLKRHCTGMDDHDESQCGKCRQMREELLALFQKFRRLRRRDYMRWELKNR